MKPSTYKIREKGRTLIYKPIRRTQMGRVGTLIGYIRDRKRHMYAALALICVVVSMTACATKFIDKVAQSRAAASKLGYRSVAEFNGWYSLRTNNPAAFKTTLDDLNMKRGAVYTVSSNLSLSLLTLEEVENAYRLAPTNQNAVVSAAAAVATQSSNIVKIVTIFTQ